MHPFRIGVVQRLASTAGVDPNDVLVLAESVLAPTTENGVTYRCANVTMVAVGETRKWWEGRGETRRGILEQVLLCACYDIVLATWNRKEGEEWLLDRATFCVCYVVDSEGTTMHGSVATASNVGLRCRLLHSGRFPT